MKARAALAFACIVAAPTAHALHRCTGADGKVTYTEFQCDAGAKASGVEMHDSAGMEPGKRTNNFSYTRPGASRTAPPPPQKTQTQEQADRTIRCRQAQANNRALNTPRPVYSIDEKGRKGPLLDDNQRNAAIETTGKEIAANCR